MTRDVQIDFDGWWSWALLDRTTGRIVGSGNHASDTSSTESMIKAWIGADYLAGVQERGEQPTEWDLDTIRQMIKFSDDNAAERLYRMRGRDAVVRRLIMTCNLTETTIHHNRWSLTEISARDAVRMGDCIADGKPAGPAWTDWLLNEMRNVDPSNAFGIKEAESLQGVSVAVKNGWTQRATGRWHIACLGIWDNWALSILTRYPTERGLGHGAGLCREVTEQLFP